MEWNDETIESLRIGWQRGDSITKIGRDMKLSPNAISGKIHRLQKLRPDEFPARPSPIVRREVPIQKRIKPQPLPPLESCSSPVKTLPPLAPLVTAPPIHLPPAAKPRPAIPAPAPVVAPITLPRRVHQCVWPIGTPGTKGFRFCSDPAILGRSYCPVHDAKAYVHVRTREPRADAPAVVQPHAQPS